MFGNIIFTLIAILILLIIMVGAVAAITILIIEGLLSEMDKENSTSVVNKPRKDTTRINK